MVLLEQGTWPSLTKFLACILMTCIYVFFKNRISGMCTGIQLQEQLGIYDYIIIDENEDVGGVWLVNTYPVYVVWKFDLLLFS